MESTLNASAMNRSFPGKGALYRATYDDKQCRAPAPPYLLPAGERSRRRSPAPPRRFNLPPLEALQRAYGFEEDEAVAFWHLRRAGSLMNQMRSADLHDELDRHEGQDGQELRQQAILLDSTPRWHSTVGQHFAALIRELGNRVLRRNFPDG